MLVRVVFEAQARSDSAWLSSTTQCIRFTDEGLRFDFEFAIRVEVRAWSKDVLQDHGGIGAEELILLGLEKHRCTAIFLALLGRGVCMTKTLLRMVDEEAAEVDYGGDSSYQRTN